MLAKQAAVGLALLASGTAATHPLLLPRQNGTNPLGDVPSQCTSICGPILSTLASCSPTDGACLCTNANGQALEACIDCIVGLNPTTAQLQQGQAILDQFDTGCQGMSLTISVSPSTSGSSATQSHTSSPGTTSGSSASSGGGSSSAATSKVASGLLVMGAVGAAYVVTLL